MDATTVILTDDEKAQIRKAFEDLKQAQLDFQAAFQKASAAFMTVANNHPKLFDN